MQSEVVIAGFKFGLYWAAVVSMIGYAVGKAIQLFYKSIVKGGE